MFQEPAVEAAAKRLGKTRVIAEAQVKTDKVDALILARLLRADLILVMEAGAIVEQGTHETLLRAGGAYRRLYDAHEFMPQRACVPWDVTSNDL